MASDDLLIIWRTYAIAPPIPIPNKAAEYERLHDRLRQAALPALERLSLLTDTADRLSE
ncbi:hypothetical protein GCM10009736_37880 [Actinomadura bangladeshensis]